MSDLIDREAALNCFHDWVDRYGDVHTPDENPEYRALEGLPSVQPERKTGRWKIIMARHKYNGEYREMRQCSECHAAYFHYANQEDIEDEIPNYCPNCGADMREVNE